MHIRFGSESGAAVAAPDSCPDSRNGDDPV